MENRVAQELSSILVDANYQQKVKDVKSAIDSCTQASIQVSGLDYNQAKLLSYWCSSTHILPEKKQFSPSLTLIADMSCGKSNAIKVAKPYCCKPELINAKNQTFPTVRDKIIWALKSGKMTIIIEEADRCKHSEELEEFVFGSYDRVTAQGSIKRLTPASSGTIFKDCSYDIFVPFILHRRHRYLDVANESRGLEIRFEPKAGKFPKAESIQIQNADKMSLITDLNLPEATQPDGVEGRVWDNCRLLIGIALMLGDTNWMQWAIERIKRDSFRLRDGREYEPRTAIFLSLIAAAKRNPDGTFKAVPLSQIKDKAASEFELKVSNRNIKSELRDLEVTLKRPRGINHAYLDEETVRKAAENLRLDPNELLGDKPPISPIMC